LKVWKASYKTCQCNTAKALHGVYTSTYAGGDLRAKNKLTFSNVSSYLCLYGRWKQTSPQTEMEHIYAVVQKMIKNLPNSPVSLFTALS